MTTTRTLIVTPTLLNELDFYPRVVQDFLNGPGRSGSATFRECIEASSQWHALLWRDLSKRLTPDDEDRAFAIENGYGYQYADDVDKAPRDDTRDSALREGWGFRYARDVDKGPRDDTRIAAIRENMGYWYARLIDKGPHDGTRAAAIENGLGYWYAVDVDQTPRDDTRAAATFREGLREEYDAWAAALTA